MVWSTAKDARPVGTKLERKYENPLDFVISEFTSRLVHPLHRIGVTPNMVTIVSLIAGLMSLYFFQTGSTSIAIVFYFIGYILDCTDGILARRYGQESEIGDVLDHSSDVMVWMGLIVLILFRVKAWNVRTVWPLVIEAILITTSYIQLCCQEKSIQGLFLPIRGLDPEKCWNIHMMKWTRFGGTGTLTLWHIFMMWFYSGQTSIAP